MSKPKIHIVGAGFSGLTLAFELSKLHHSVVIYESSDRVGGLIQTHRLGDSLAEAAANAFYANNSIVQLCHELNLNILQKSKISRKRYIFRERKPHRWPLHFLETFHLLLKGILFLFTKKNPEINTPVSDWWTKNFSKSSLQFLLSPALQGIYAGNTRSMSARLIFDQFFGKNKSKLHHQIRGSFSFQYGMQEFIDALEKKLKEKNVEIHLRHSLSSETLLNLIQNGDQVVFCCGPKKASNYIHELKILSDNSKKNILRESSPLLKVLPQLQSLELVSLLKITIVYDVKISDLPHDEIRGFGILFPQEEKMQTLGVLMDSSIFKDRGNQLCETWILGGALQPEMIDWNDEKILDAALSDRAKIFKHQHLVKTYKIFRWRETLPHYNFTLEYLVENYVPQGPLYLHGNYLGKIGLSKIYENSIKLAKFISHKI